ncbi:MAG: siderophore-interacting protein [Caulobacterales bacterium]
MTVETFPFPARAHRPTWPLTVVGAADLTPRMRRVSLVGESLTGFAYRPGQDLALMLPDARGQVARRHYTIRRFDPVEQRLEIDVVLHGQSPGAEWARGARIGDPLIAQGPRGRTVVSGRADWHLFTGDETALPAIFAMVESLPAGATAFAILEVEGAEEEQALETDARLDLTWIHRNGPPGPSSPALIEALAAFQLPAGAGHAYVIGETSTVRSQRQGLIARGFPKHQIAAEGYWRPGRTGGHDHVDLPDFLTPRDARGWRGGRMRRDRHG